MINMYIHDKYVYIIYILKIQTQIYTCIHTQIHIQGEKEGGLGWGGSKEKKINRYIRIRYLEIVQRKLADGFEEESKLKEESKVIRQYLM